ncbi:SAM-dependent methyltransferase [Kribbella sp. NPDC050820]|uniref:SAM-dependent methyltransferase n=1 Tax=Kribbella sp. NPDC050820 TaxID=3155408 RepID=UPI0033CFE363
MEAPEIIDWGQVAKDQAVLARGYFARFRDAALGGKDHYAAERNLLAEVAKSVPDVADLFKASERLQVDAIRRLSSRARLKQWIHCGPGFPTTAGVQDTHRVVLPSKPLRKVLYVTDHLVIDRHSRALRRPDDAALADQVRVISADIFRPHEIRKHPDIDGWLDWSQPIVLIHGDAWIHYPGTANQAAGIMQRWIDQLVNGSYTISSHLLRPDDEAAAACAEHLEQMIASTPVDTLRFRTRDEIKSLFPKQKMAGFAKGLEHDPAIDPQSGTLLHSWVVSGVGRVTGSVPPSPPPGSVGVAEASEITGYSRYQVIGLAENGLLPSTTGPRGRWQFQPDEIRSIVTGWESMPARGLTPPTALPRRELAPADNNA